MPPSLVVDDVLVEGSACTRMLHPFVDEGRSLMDSIVNAHSCESLASAGETAPGSTCISSVIPSLNSSSGRLA
eukprot:12808492-Alexandrium_andersonii.AAC.1